MEHSLSSTLILVKSLLQYLTSKVGDLVSQANVVKGKTNNAGRPKRVLARDWN